MTPSITRFALALVALSILTTLACRPRSGGQSKLCTTSEDCPTNASQCAPDGLCVPCITAAHCDCHEQCIDSACAPLGASAPHQTLNAHGNWTGTPGTTNYIYKNACEVHDDCGIGQICNPLTRGCITASLFAQTCDPQDNDTCPLGPQGETLVCDATSQRCLPSPTCLLTHNCCTQDNLVCDTSANICRAIADECTPPAELTSTCPFLPKDQDTCLTGNFCSEAGTCVQCTCDADCGSDSSPSLKCHLPTSTCKPLDYCSVPSDCHQPSQSCDTQNNTCAPACSEATATADCGADFFCHPEDKVCRSKSELPCSNDAFYPNRSAATAANLTLPALNQTSLETDLSVCDGDSDWFQLSLQAGERVAITMSSPSASMSATYSIISPDGLSVLADGILSPAASRLLSFTANRTRGYFLRVTPTENSEGFYSLSIALSQGQICADPFEASAHNDTPASATLLFNESTSTAPSECLLETSPPIAFIRCAADQLTLCIGDVDYYKVTLDQPSDLEFTIKDYAGELNLLVYGPFTESEAFDSTNLAGGQDLNPGFVKKVQLISPDSATFFVKISRSLGSASHYSYTLQTRILPDTTP